MANNDITNARKLNTAKGFFLYWEEKGIPLRNLDIQVGAVELKDGSTDTRQSITVDGAAIGTNGANVFTARAVDFDGSAFPNNIDEGDGGTVAMSPYRVQYVKVVSEDGSQSVEDEITNAVNTLPLTAPGSTVTTLFNAQVLNATTTATSASLLVGQNEKVTFLIQVTKTNAPTDFDLYLESSPDNGTTWVGQNSATEGIGMIDSNQGGVTVLTYTASGEDSFTLPGDAGHKQIRVQLVGAGTDASNTFTVSLFVIKYSLT